MLKWLILSITISLFSAAIHADNSKRPLFYVGIAKNDQPFTLLNSKREASGLLVNFLNSICDHLNRKCDFYSKKHIELINVLKNQQIHALVVSDMVVLPDVDNALITPPICNINPIFVQKSTDDIYFKQTKDLERKTIGVKEGSALHLYLIKNYAGKSYIKTYPMMESAIFDLFFERIDAVFVDEAFYQDRVYNSPLGDPESEMQLIATKVEGISIPFNTMAIAVSNARKKLYNDIVDFMKGKSVTNCAGMLNKNLAILY